MPSTSCLSGPLFSLSGPTYFAATDIGFELVLDDPSESAQVLAVEWYLDGLLVVGINGLTIAGKAGCGEHTLGARLLVAGGWSGVKKQVFYTCKVPTAEVITGADTVDEGAFARYYVIRHFSDGSTEDITGQFTFTASGHGTFTANKFTASQNDQSYESFEVVVSALRNGVVELTRNITVINTTPVIVTSYTLIGPGFVDEGKTAEYGVTAAYSDGSEADVSAGYTFSSTEGSFSGRTFTAPANDTPNDTRQVTLTATPNGGGAALSKNVTVRDTYELAGILVVDLFNNQPLNAIGLVDNAEIANNHVAAYTGHNVVPSGAAPADALILASDYISQPTLNWRFEFNISKLMNENPATNVFVFYVKGRSSSPGSISGAFVLKTLQTEMTLSGSAGTYLPSATGGSNLGQTVQFSSQVLQGLNGSYNEANLLTIIRLEYNVATKLITYTTA
jgi:hypothetical protein